MLRNWPKEPFKNAIVNQIWQILPSFIGWENWKERNKWIFRGTLLTIDRVWETIQYEILETICLRSWEKANWYDQGEESRILKNWGTVVPLQCMGIPKNQHAGGTIQCRWEDPPPGCYKLNFDGASKCNPENSGFEGIIQDHIGETKAFFYGWIGHDTNNATKIEALIHGLGIAQLQNWLPLEVEGDSKLVIGMTEWIHNGTQCSQVSLSWHLEYRLERLEEIF